MKNLDLIFGNHVNEFGNILPNIVKPFKGESLWGYLIRLDYANNYPIGTVLSAIKLHSTSTYSLNKPGLFICGTIFNLEKLTSITCLTYKELDELTFSPYLQKLFHTERVYPEMLGYSNNFKICPNCIKENKLPLIHILNDITICSEHRMRLIDKCACGKSLHFFSKTEANLSCPKCSKSYKELISKSTESIDLDEYIFYELYSSIFDSEVSLINDNEDINSALEYRFHYILKEKGISASEFKSIFGYSIANAKNGQGLKNISLQTIIRTINSLGYTLKGFQNIQFQTDIKKISNISINTKEHTCPNVYCSQYQVYGNDNIKQYGKRKSKSGAYLMEEYCKICGTRFIGDNIIQSYDYNPGLRQYEIDKTQERIKGWQNSLMKVCEEMIKNRVPITLTNCFKKARIPIGKTYFIDRLGLISILEEYAEKQVLDTSKWIHELGEKDATSFLHRIYKRKKK